MTYAVRLALCALVWASGWAEPGQLSSGQLVRLRKSGLLVILPGYVPKGFVVTGLELNSLEYRVFYQGPRKANFSVWGRKSGVADGGPARQHFRIKQGPFRGEFVEYEDGVFYTGFLRLKPRGGENSPSFDIEGQKLSPGEALKIVESLRQI